MLAVAPSFPHREVDVNGLVNAICTDLVVDVVSDAVVLARPDPSTQVWLLPAAASTTTSTMRWVATDTVPSRKTVIGWWGDAFRTLCLSAWVGCCIAPRDDASLLASLTTIAVDSNGASSKPTPSHMQPQRWQRFYRILPQLSYFIDPDMGSRVSYTVRILDATAEEQQQPAKQSTVKVYHRSRLVRVEGPSDCLPSRDGADGEPTAVVDALQLYHLYAPGAAVEAAEVASQETHDRCTGAEAPCIILAAPGPNPTPPLPTPSLWFDVDDLIESVALYLSVPVVLHGLALVSRRCWRVSCRDGPLLRHAIESYRYRWTQQVVVASPCARDRIRQCLLACPLVPLPFVALEQARCSVGIVSAEFTPPSMMRLLGVDGQRRRRRFASVEGGALDMPEAPWHIVQRAVLRLEPWYSATYGALSEHRVLVAVLTTAEVGDAVVDDDAGGCGGEDVMVVPTHRRLWVGEAISCFNEAQVRCFFRHPLVVGMHCVAATSDLDGAQPQWSLSTTTRVHMLDIWWHTPSPQQDETACGWSVSQYVDEDGGPQQLQYRFCRRFATTSSSDGVRSADGAVVGGVLDDPMLLEWQRLHAAVAEQRRSRAAQQQWSAM